MCALVDAALREAGFSTGRYTSPHLVSVCERFLLNGAPADPASIDAAFRAVPASAPLTYFELLTATAFELYRRANVDRVVLETGLGGRLDATNVIERPDVCIITRIGLDHCDWLGHTLEAIAAEKGGIIKERVPVVLGAMPHEARVTLEGIAASRDAPCVYAPESVAEDEIPRNLSLKGAFNRENAVTALAALKVLRVRRDAVERGFAAASWPGRYQRVTVGGRVFMVDGAHNPPAMRALVDSLREDEAAGLKPEFRTAICGFCGDKDVAANLGLLAGLVKRGIAVSIRNPRSLSAERTAGMMRTAGFPEVSAAPTLQTAIDAAPSGTVICGSLFLAGEALQALGVIPQSAAFTPNEPIPCGNRSLRI